MNRVLLIGNLLYDPELRVLDNNRTIAYLSLVTNDKKKADYHKIIAWDRVADMAAGLKKGDRVFIEGRLQSRHIREDDGVKLVPEIVAWTLYLLPQFGLDRNYNG